MQSEQEFLAPSESKKTNKNNENKEPKGRIDKAVTWAKTNKLMLGVAVFCIAFIIYQFSSIFLSSSKTAKQEQAVQQIQNDITTKYQDKNVSSDNAEQQEKAVKTQQTINETTQQTDEQLKQFVQQNQKPNISDDNTNAKIASNNSVNTDANTNDNIQNEDMELIWKKKTLLLFKNPNDSYFLLDQEIPSLIANNFKQDPNNQNRISGHNAKIANISFIKPERNEEFLNIKLIIESIDEKKYSIVKIFPILNYVDLAFYEDCVIKTSSNGDENILVKGDYIFPYMRIAGIGKRDDGANIIRLEINQEKFGGPNFIYDYEVN